MPSGIDGNDSCSEFFISNVLQAATLDSFDPQEDFAWTKGLRDVVLSAELEAGDPVMFARLRAQDNDWDMARGAIRFEDLANLDAGHFREHEIENNQPWRFRSRLL